MNIYMGWDSNILSNGTRRVGSVEFGECFYIFKRFVVDTGGVYEISVE